MTDDESFATLCGIVAKLARRIEASQPYGLDDLRDQVAEVAASLRKKGDVSRASVAEFFVEQSAPYRRPDEGLMMQ